jgi:hypothetical protein
MIDMRFPRRGFPASFPTVPAMGPTVHRDAYGGGKLGSEVVVYTIAGGGHTSARWSAVFTCVSGGKGQSKSRRHERDWGIFQQA